MNIDKMMIKIAIEEAPGGIVKRWRIKLRLRQAITQRNWNWLYIVFPILFAGIFFGLYLFNIGIQWNIETLDFVEFLKTILSIISSYEFLVISPGFLIASIVLSSVTASLSLLWYYMQYGKIKL